MCYSDRKEKDKCETTGEKKGVVVLLSARRGRIKIRHLLFGVGHGGDAPSKIINTYLYIYLNLYLQTDRQIDKQAKMLTWKNTM